LGRPLVDTVYNSKYTNMKELRVQHRGKPIRPFFAFDPLRQATVFTAFEIFRSKLTWLKLCKNYWRNVLLRVRYVFRKWQKSCC
ncbi:type II toxin-antitoxin system RelE/ParE family toxin, partial [Pseudomonas aeruginosa]